VFVDGLLILGTQDGNLYAVDKRTGEMRWKFNTGSSSDPEWENNWIFPIAAANGVVYFGNANGYLYAVDIKTGRQKWKLRTGRSLYSGETLAAAFRPAVSDGVVYFAGCDGCVRAVDGNSGKLKWKFKLNKEVIRFPNGEVGGGYMEEIAYAPVVAGGVVYFSDWEGRNLHAVDADTGTLKWRFRVENVHHSPEPGGSLRPVVADGVVLFGSQNGCLYAVDMHSGKEKWHFRVGPPGLKAPPGPAVSNGKVFFGSRTGYVYGFDSATGKQLWRFDVRPAEPDVRRELDEQGEYPVSLPVVAGGLVLYYNGYGDLYAVDATSGGLRWKFRTQPGWVPGPVVAGGLVYVASPNGQIHCLDQDTGRQLERIQVRGSRKEKVPKVVYFKLGPHDLASHRDLNSDLDSAQGDLPSITHLAMSDHTLYVVDVNNAIHAMPYGRSALKTKATER